MVFVSKEPGLFGGNIRLSILINGDEAHSEWCAPEDADELAIKAIDGIIRSSTDYLLKQAPNVRHIDILRLRQLIAQSTNPCEAIADNLALIRKHLPGGKLKNACHSKLQEMEMLAEYRKALAELKTTET